MSDLTERLRAQAEHHPVPVAKDLSLYAEAAARIEALETALAKADLLIALLRRAASRHGEDIARPSDPNYIAYREALSDGGSNNE